MLPRMKHTLNTRGANCATGLSYTPLIGRIKIKYAQRLTIDDVVIEAKLERHTHFYDRCLLPKTRSNNFANVACQPPNLELKSLEPPDVRTYLLHHPETPAGLCEVDTIEKLHERSGGLPMHIDRMIRA
jgi:hypothetical protein